MTQRTGSIYNARLSAGLGLLDETRSLLDLWAPGMSPSALHEASLTSGRFPTISYTLWIYYHRLNDQTIYTCVNDFVEPKLRDIAIELITLRQNGNGIGRSRDDEKKLENLQDSEIELHEFRDELLRVARLPWKPNLNDGVQITAAPLWTLFQLPKWKKTLKETWEKLKKGDYDWAHLAYSIWPDRVREKCKKDKSLAIAHNLEDFCIEPPVSAKKKRSKKVEVVEDQE